MTTRPRPLLSPLSSQTFRMYPSCRTLAFKRRQLRLSQTRLAAICIVAALSIPDETKQTLAKWILNNESIPLGDTTAISKLEAGTSRWRQTVVQCLKEVSRILDWYAVNCGSELREMRERLKLSQTRLATICIVIHSDLPEPDKKLVIGQIVANRFDCPMAGDQPSVSLIETGCGKLLTRKAMAAFCKGFELVLGREITAGELFDDWLEEVAIEMEEKRWG